VLGNRPVRLRLYVPIRLAQVKHNFCPAAHPGVAAAPDRDQHVGKPHDPRTPLLSSGLQSGIISQRPAIFTTKISSRQREFWGCAGVSRPLGSMLRSKISRGGPKGAIKVCQAMALSDSARPLVKPFLDRTR
jgi:hypothetical protein